ncbi:MAG: hypothetical protein SGCHY_003261 [Lobulomycetales sp.]
MEAAEEREPEVFETLSNGDDEASRHGDSDSDGIDAESPVDIDKQHLPADVSSRFRSGLDTHCVDYSDSIARKKRRNPLPHFPDRALYSFDTAPEAAETVVEKLSRLTFEIDELSSALKASESSANNGAGDGNKSAPASYTQMMDQISNLSTDLTRMAGMIGTPDDEIATPSNRASSLANAKSLITSLEALKADASATMDATQPDNAAKNPERGPGDTISYELYYSPPTAAAMSRESLASLEARLAKLETSIGTQFLATNTSGSTANSTDTFLSPTSLSIPGITGGFGKAATICQALTNLSESVNLLTQPGAMDALSRRLDAVLGEFQQVDEQWKRRRALEELDSDFAAAGAANGGELNVTSSKNGSSSGHVDSGKIEYLYNMLESMDSTAHMLPHLIARLHALKELHGEAVVYADGLKDLDANVTGLEDVARRLGKGLQDVQDTVVKNEATVLGNVQRIEERMEALGKRIDKLLE